MKLVDILARELEEWPVGRKTAYQSNVDDEIYFDERGGINGCKDNQYLPSRMLADDLQTAEVTENDWQAARAAYLASVQPARDAQIVESALQTQQGGTHYKDLKIQPIEYIHANGLDFFQGNIVKYATRHKDKNGVEDLRKVIHYAQLAIELQYGEKP